jgi:ubiquinone/menaquinone biosynthesis C-methylase UbiE
VSDEFKAFESAGWAARAETYDDVMGAVTARFVEPLLDAAGVGAGTRLLDAACGPGTLAAAAAVRGASVVGIDLAPGMVELASERHPSLRFLQGDVEHLPFEDGSFDAVVAGFLLHHVPDPDRAVAELARALTRGGRLAATVWDRPERMRLLGLANDALARAGADATAGLPEGPDAFGFAEPSELAALLERGGFEAVRVRTLQLTHRAASADELWEGLLGGTVRTTEQVNEQPARVQERIRAAFTDLAQEHRGEDGALEVPVAAVLADAILR